MSEFKGAHVRLPECGISAATFLLTYHNGANDLPLDLQSDFEGADIVFHERIGWRQSDIDDMNSVSRGNTNISMVPSELNARITDLIVGSGSLQASWDVRAAHLSAPKYLKYFGSQVVFRDRTDFETYYEMVTGRDRLALRTLGRQIDRYVERGLAPAHPKVLVLAGLSHLMLAGAYEATAPAETTIKTSYAGMSYDAATEYVQKRLSGDEPEIALLVKRASFERMIRSTTNAPHHEVVAMAQQLATP